MLGKRLVFLIIIEINSSSLRNDTLMKWAIKYLNTL